MGTKDTGTKEAGTTAAGNGAPNEALHLLETVEGRRLADRDAWLQWGPYLAERQWGTVREDYSADR